MTYGETTISEVLSAVASKQVAPAGGTVTAIVGAMGAALCEMVWRHEPREPTLSTGEAEWEKFGETLQTHQKELLDLAGADAAVIEEVFPVTGDGSRPADGKRAVGVPLAIAETCATVLESGASIATATDGPRRTDAKTGVILAHAALQAALLTVRSNCSLLDDQEFLEETTSRVNRLETKAEETVDAVLTAPDPES